MEIKLSGPFAIVALLLVAGFVFFQYAARNKSLESEAVEVLKTWLVAKYARAQLPQLEKLAKDPSANEEEIEQLVGQLSRDSIKFVSINARGKGDDIVVRAEIEVNGEDPPDGERICYFRMRHSMITGWQYEREISKWSYYLAF